MKEVCEKERKSDIETNDHVDFTFESKIICL